MTGSSLKVDGLRAGWNGIDVLFGIDLEVPAGGCLALLGRNGMGKTTTLRAVCGLNRPSAGSVILDNVRVDGRAPGEAARRGVGFVPEDRRVFADLTVEENLLVAARGGPGRPWSRAEVFELFPDLRAHASRRAGNLSGGQQQMLTIGRTLTTAPTLLLLDEPSEGLAPVIVDALLDRIRALRQSGLTIVLAEQSLDFCLAIADRVAVIEKGVVRHVADAVAFAADAALQARLLSV